jgi:hypothetical protein
LPWLKVDDGLPEHRKLLHLKRADRWTWVELLCYCARQGDQGRVPHGISEVLRYATPSFIATCIESGLIDQEQDGTLWIHDWDIYNGSTVAERVTAFLARNPDAPSNEVHKAVGGKREIVLAELHKQRAA